MNRKYLLECAFSELEEVEYKSQGGCAIIALALYRFLRGMGEEVEAHFIELLHEDHYVLEIDGILYDGECSWGLLNEHSAYNEYWGEDAVLREINIDQWNSSFERETWVPVIEEILAIDLSDVRIF